MDRHLRQLLMETPGGRAYLDKIDAAKKSKRARHAPSRRAKRDVLAERSARAAAVRDAIRTRVKVHGGRCEFCALVEPSEFHHVLGGSRRRSAEAVETVAWICMPCHREWHRGEDSALYRAERWANFYGYTETLKAIDKRRAKAEEARRTA